MCKYILYEENSSNTGTFPCGYKRHRIVRSAFGKSDYSLLIIVLRTSHKKPVD